MASESLAQLQKRIEQLEASLRKTAGAVVAPSKNPKDRPDYVERGSDRHAAMLGLKKAKDEELALEGWTLEDITQFGPSATKEYLTRVLEQKVNELTSPVPPVQSRNQFEPHFAPTMWRTGTPLSQITE